MKFDTSGLDQGDLAIELGRAYDLPVASVAFVPKGEDALCYVATAAAGEQYFVRAKPVERGPEAEEIYEAVAALRDRLGIPCGNGADCILPREASRWEFRGHVVTVYPFVAGASVYDSGAPSAHVSKTARIMAVLHRSDHPSCPRCHSSGSTTRSNVRSTRL